MHEVLGDKPFFSNKPSTRRLQLGIGKCMKSLDPWMLLNDLPTCCDEMLYAKCVQSMIELKVMSKLRT